MMSLAVGLLLTARVLCNTDVPLVQLEEHEVGGYHVLRGRETAVTAQPFFVLKSSIGHELLNQALAEVQAIVMDDHNDEADWLPAYEAYIMEQGSFFPELAGPSLRRAVLQLQDIAMPFVRQVYKCETCVPCTSFVRRYLQKERVRVPAHFDVTAYATVIVPLTPALNYSGGFFVQPTAHVDSRLFVPLQLGDIAVHDFTLNHGIEVLDGGRYSLVLWVSEEHSSCRLSKTPWHAQRALEGDAVAQHILGMMFGQGNGAPQDDARALEWTVRAAEGGLANAQFSAGTMYFEGQGTPVDFNRSFFWYEQAASQGDASAQILLARMLNEGLGTETPDPAMAAYWYNLGVAQADKGVALSAPPSWPQL